MTGLQLFRTSAKYGAYLGLFMCVFTLFMWLSELDTTYYHVGKNLDLLVSIVPAAMILYAIYKLKRNMNLSVTQRILIGITVGMVSVLISTPFIEIYHNFINPEWFNAVLRVQENKMVEAGVSLSDINARLEQLRAGNTIYNAVLNAVVFGGIVFPAIISTISLIIIRNKKKDELENENSLYIHL